MLGFAGLALQNSPSFDFAVRPSEGLVVSVEGVPVISGTWFQIYEPDWSKQHFASGRNPKIVTEADGTIGVKHQSPDGLSEVVETYERKGNRLRVTGRFVWNGDKPVRVEATAGMIYAPAFAAGQVKAAPDGTWPLMPPKGGRVEQRRFGPDGTTYEFDAPFATLKMTSSKPVTLFDGRGYDQPWAIGKSLLWMGFLEAPIAKGQPFEYQVDWEITPKPAVRGSTVRSEEKVQALPNAESPVEERLPLVPKPKAAKLDYAKPIQITGAYAFPVGRVRYWNDFIGGLKNRFQMGPPAKGARPLTFDAGVSLLGKRPGGYELTLRPDGRVSILGEEDEGLRNGLRRLAALAFVRGGKLWLPTGTITDSPSLPWRGVHLFVGPRSRSFHARLWDRVLSPLGMNKVVLQCERTQWKSTPLDPSLNPMAREDLALLFGEYRQRGVEPTPLIQSLGHMEWFFAGGKRKELAYNPEVPYTIDLRKPEALQAIQNLWAEAADLLKPKMMHFGCDEIDMRGFAPGSHAITTDIWTKAMPELGAIAKQHQAQMAIWGDNGLAPGEAVDATHGHSLAEAAKRREAIPRQTWIADWHYRADPKPETFYPSLQLWKREGYRPIASGWYRPENVRGFALAADLERTGYLQTTWAGYESEEGALLRHYEQFSAMVLAADYAWSGRQESLKDLGYDVGEVFRKMYFSAPSVLTAVPGSTVGTGPTFKVGRYGFGAMKPVALQSRFSGGTDAVENWVLPLKASAARITLALEAKNEAEDGAILAEVVAVHANGNNEIFPVRYGHHVRTASDTRVLPFGERGSGRSSILLSLAKRSELKEIQVRSSGPVGGLMVCGVSLW